MAKDKTHDNTQEIIERTAQALAKYSHALELLEWLRENKLLATSESNAELAYAAHIYYEGTAVRKNLEFLNPNPVRFPNR